MHFGDRWKDSSMHEMHLTSCFFDLPSSTVGHECNLQVRELSFLMIGYLLSPLTQSNLWPQYLRDSILIGLATRDREGVDRWSLTSKAEQPKDAICEL